MNVVKKAQDWIPRACRSAHKTFPRQRWRYHKKDSSLVLRIKSALSLRAVILTIFHLSFDISDLRLPFDHFSLLPLGEGRGRGAKLLHETAVSPLPNPLPEGEGEKLSIHAMGGLPSRGLTNESFEMINGKSEGSEPIRTRLTASLPAAHCFPPLAFQELLRLVQPTLISAVLVGGCGLDGFNAGLH